MKIIAQILTVTLVIHLIVPVPCFAQQNPDENIVQLREEIAKLEQADQNPDLPAEVRALNREFLSTRKIQLQAIVNKRIAALQQYLTAMEQVLKPAERQAVENSIKNLSAQLGSVEPAPTVRPVSEPRVDVAANNVVKTTVPISAPPVYGRSNNIPALMARADRNFFLPPTVLPVSLMQPGGAGSTAKSEDFVINVPADEVPKPKEVENGTVVTVKGTKRPIDVCVVATKREELKPEPNPLAAFLKILIGLGPFSLADSKGPDCAIGSAVSVPAGPDAQRIEADLKALRARIVLSINDVNIATQDYANLGAKVSAFTNCKQVRVLGGVDVLDPNGDYVLDAICDNAGTFNIAKTTIKKQVETTLVKTFPVLDSVELQMAALRKALTDYKKVGGDTEEAWTTDVSNRLDCNSRALNELRKEVTFLQTSREQFESFLKLLDGHTSEDSYEKELIADSTAKVTGTVTCTNYFTKQPSFDPIPFTVTYQGFSRHAISAGILFATLNKRQIGITPVRTGVNADGTSALRLTFTETDKGDAQIIPFSFYNYRFWGGRKFNLNGSGGVGINPNNGATQVEFFFGGAVGLQNVFIHFGGHAGRWQELGGGFTLGDTVPAVIPVPIERRYTIRPAVGVSYKLPLP